MRTNLIKENNDIYYINLISNAYIIFYTLLNILTFVYYIHNKCPWEDLKIIYIFPYYYIELSKYKFSSKLTFQSDFNNRKYISSIEESSFLLINNLKIRSI